MKYFLFISFFFANAGTWAGPVDNCFQRFGNCDIIYSDPYRKVWRVNNSTCLENCAIDFPRCKAVVYDVEFSVCNLYAFTGNSGPGFLIPAYKKVYYQVYNADCVALYTPSTTVEITTVELTNPPVAGAGGAPAQTEAATNPPVTTTNAPETATTASPAGGATSPGNSSAVLTSSAATEATSTPVTETATTSTVAAGSNTTATAGKVQHFIQPPAGCTKEKQPVYLGYMETNITLQPGVRDGIIMPNVGDVATCIKACSENKDRTGRAMNCLSFTYVSSTERCLFHPFPLSPDGTNRITNVKGVHSFAKVCIQATDSNSKCNNAMLVTAPGIELRRHELQKLNNVGSLEDCTESCLMEISCKSLTYYAHQSRCILHDADSLTAPDEFGPAEPTTIFVENSCGSSGRRQEAHVDRAGVNRFDKSETKQLAEDLENRDLKEEVRTKENSRSEKPKKITPKKNPKERASSFTEWGEWTKCLNRDHGPDVRVRIRLCKEENQLRCHGKRAEYRQC